MKNISQNLVGIEWFAGVARIATRLMIGLICLNSSLSLAQNPQANVIDYTQMNDNDLKDLCELGDEKACNIIKENEQNVEQKKCDEGNAMICFSIAEKLEYEYSRLSCESVFINGKRQQKCPHKKADIDKAIALYSKSCEYKYAPACEKAGQIYIESRMLLPKDSNKALSYYTKSCETQLEHYEQVFPKCLEEKTKALSDWSSQEKIQKIADMCAKNKLEKMPHPLGMTFSMTEADRRWNHPCTKAAEIYREKGDIQKALEYKRKAEQTEDNF